MTSNPFDRNRLPAKLHSPAVNSPIPFTQRVDSAGFSLVEVLITLAIFSIVLAGAYQAYISQIKDTSREYRIAEADVELGIAQTILTHDLERAGFGLAEDYAGTGFDPRAISATNGDPDDLTLTATSLGLGSRSSEHWTYISSVTGGVPSFKVWGDAREDMATNDRVVLMEPSTQRLLAEGGEWLFSYIGSSALPTTVGSATALSTPTVGTLVYGLHANSEDVATQPYHVVRYWLGGNSPDVCAPGTLSLLRAESRTANPPPSSSGRPLLACVRDFEVVFDLDTNEDGSVDFRAEGGQHGSIDTARNLRRRLKEVRAYILVQVGSRDPSYTYPVANVRVGDSSLGTGRNVTLTADQRQYRWRVISLNVTPRNIR